MQIIRQSSVIVRVTAAAAARPDPSSDPSTDRASRDERNPTELILDVTADFDDVQQWHDMAPTVDVRPSLHVKQNICSDVDRGQTPEDEAEDKITRPRTIFF